MGNILSSDTRPIIDVNNLKYKFTFQIHCYKNSQTTSCMLENRNVILVRCPHTTSLNKLESFLDLCFNFPNDFYIISPITRQKIDMMWYPYERNFKPIKLDILTQCGFIDVSIRPKPEALKRQETRMDPETLATILLGCKDDINLMRDAIRRGPYIYERPGCEYLYFQENKDRLISYRKNINKFYILNKEIRIDNVIFCDDKYILVNLDGIPLLDQEANILLNDAEIIDLGNHFEEEFLLF